MYSKEMLQGILLSLGRHNLVIYVNENAKLGYSVKFYLDIRGEEEFLESIQRTLLQYSVLSSIVSSGNRPTLRITGIKNLVIISALLPDLPSYRNDVQEFKDIVAIFVVKRHKTLEGLEELMKIKGVL
jgi:hypothetical protein|tara:strand:+ start:598 stop:981 length:384 start_codon:yes stop_codon:yes gene_type:complete